MNAKYLIIEDEAVPAERLRNLVCELRPEYRPEGVADSIEDAVDFLKNNKVDLVFMDVELADGNCFEIFDYVKVDVPIIFTTAYSEYAIRAFKVNSIEYLLKPIKKLELEAALDKFETIGRAFPGPDYETAGTEIYGSRNKKRVLISKGDGYFHINVEDAAYFRSEDKYTFVHTFDGHEYLLDFTLNKLSGRLNPEDFFRISRNYIVNIRSVKDIRKFFDGRLKVALASNPEPVEVIVSAARREDFLRWLGGDI